MVVKTLQDEVTYKKSNEYCDKKVFKDLEKLVAKSSNCLLKEGQEFLTDDDSALKVAQKISSQVIIACKLFA